MTDSGDAILRVEGLEGGYGRRQVLYGVGVEVSASQIVAIVGHNGAGKSTLLKAVFGLLPIWAGRIYLFGQSLQSPDPRRLIRLGVNFVPQGNRVFMDLSVRENLEMGRIAIHDGRRTREQIERVLSLFPVLRSRLGRRASTLSGGERQMLALGTTLVSSPRLLLLDEPSLGLSAMLVSTVLQEIRKMSYVCGTAVLIVEQKVRQVLTICDRVYVLRNGRVSFSGPAALLKDEARLKEAYLWGERARD